MEALELDPTTLGDPTGEECASGDRRWAVMVVAHPDAAIVGRRAIVDGIVELARGGDALGPGGLDHPRVSRDHAHLERLPDGALHVVDRGGRNGTTVNGVRVGGAVLATGDVVGLGPILLLVHRLPPPVAVPPRAWVDGTSAASAALAWRTEAIAARSGGVVITGEIGAGKSRLARALAAARGGPVIVIDGATVDAADAAALLLGRGNERGRLDGADGGALVVEALDRAPRELAAALDGFLDDGLVRGDRAVDARVIATAHDASAIPLATLTRLPLRIAIPPLRERLEDVPALVRAHGDRPLHHSFVLRLLRDAWLGNVRELFGVLERAALDQPGVEPLRHSDAAPVADVPPSSQLVVARDGTWFAPPDCDRVPLGKRGNLARIVAALAARRSAQPGSVLAVADLLEIGWPGERVVERAGPNRVHVALTALRNLGLRDVLERVDDGYRLALATPVQLVDPAC